MIEADKRAVLAAKVATQSREALSSLALINQDYSVSGYDVYSGSEADAASFAIRMAIAKTSRIKNFNSVILDEISSSFDTQKEEILIDLLKQSSNQIIYISHGDIV